MERSSWPNRQENHRKSLYMLRLLKRARADPKTLISVYITCIRSVAEYGTCASMTLKHS